MVWSDKNSVFLVCSNCRFVKVPTLVGVYKSMVKLNPEPSLEASMGTVVERLLKFSPEKATEFIEKIGSTVKCPGWSDREVCGGGMLVCGVGMLCGGGMCVG